ncbi:MAG: Lpg1974 family pore-forming outer membrane protein [Parachlamydiales bacterium]
MSVRFLVALLLTAQSGAIEFFGGPLYWRATETAEWAVTLSPFPNPSRVAYQTISFDWDPGLRVGAAYRCGCWDTQLAYTQFWTRASDRVRGNVVSGFLGTTVLQIGPYEAGGVRWSLDYLTLDWEGGRTYFATPRLSFRPAIGLKGGRIYQSIRTEWENLAVLLVATENLQQKFWGFGPKGSLGANWTLCRQLSLFADFGAAFMWGHWSISDHFLDDFGTGVDIQTGRRNFGSLVVQGLMGVSFAYSPITFKLGYEIQDWFNQYQVFDDTTGTHNNDLVLRGLSFSLLFAY